MSQSLWVRDRFLMSIVPVLKDRRASQSLWVRDRFLIDIRDDADHAVRVAIPLGQGQVFNISILRIFLAE